MNVNASGYSAKTRWREDATRDDWGAYVYLRDMDSGRVWSAAAHPLGIADGNHDVVFAEDHATFTRKLQ